MPCPLNRRHFLRSSLAGMATTGFYTSSRPSLAARLRSPAEQPVVGFVGTGIRFHTALGRGATEFGPCAAVCDVDAVQLGRAKQVILEQHYEHGRPLVVPAYEDYRRVLDRQDIDAVFIATPDHWHTKIAIEAMQAGKDVYCEKPLTLTIREGRQLLEVMRRTERVVQVGTQQRTEYDQMFAQAVAVMRDGRIGRAKRVTVAIGGSLASPSLPAIDPPKHLNWNLWLGPAPLTDYRMGDIIHDRGWGAGFPLGRAHRYYRWWYEYSGGKLSDWGAHHVDIAMWALDKVNSDNGHIEIEPLHVEHPVPFQDGMPLEDDKFNAATKFSVRVTFPDGVEMMVRDSAADLGFANGIMFEGEKGRFLVNRGKIVGKPIELLAENPLPDDWLARLYGHEPPESHIANFMDCLKTRRVPISDVSSHNRMLAVCHAINVALRLNRRLTFDSQKEEFVGDAEANRFVERTPRAGFEIHV